MSNPYEHLLDKPFRKAMAASVRSILTTWDARFYGRFTLGMRSTVERGRRIDRTVVEFMVGEIDKAALIAVRSMETGGEVEYPTFGMSSWAITHKVDGEVVVDIMFVPTGSASTTVNEKKAARMFMFRALDADREIGDILREARQRYAVSEEWLLSTVMEMADDSVL